MKNRTILIITDGIGHSLKTEFNAFYSATKPTYDELFKTTPYSMIETYGLSVGLPEGQMGNSEVGHMCIGSGRVLYQDLVEISLSLKNDTLKNKPEYRELLEKSKDIHLVGLMSDGGVHSHIEHFLGIAKLISKEDKRVFLHLISDGRDVSPTSAKTYISMVENVLDKNITIASLGGRFYAMDRDSRWDRVKLGYDAIVEATPKTTLSPKSYIDESYKKEELDEFIKPVAFDGYDGIKDGDGVLCINFRSDRMRQLVSALAKDDFSGFVRDKRAIHLVTMSEYDKNFSYPVLFKKDSPKNTLAEVISKANLRQLHTAETEKYAHVTFFLNGGIEEPFVGETRVLIPSPKVKTYDEKPQMSAFEVGDVVLKGMDEGFDFIVVNFANGDMVGHTGNFEAAKIAVNAVDTQLGKIVSKAKELGYAIVLTSDHGNCEEMRDDDGNILTNHTVGKVWCFVMADGVVKLKDGGLNNIAPTVLKLMGLKIPQEMDEPLF